MVEEGRYKINFFSFYLKYQSLTLKPQYWQNFPIYAQRLTRGKAERARTKHVNSEKCK